ncbi:MAG: response regulator transcription factor [Candidatus Hydrogenedentota bacterium]
MQFIKVLIADDHTMVREGLRKMLSARKDIIIVGEATNGEEAIALAFKEFPDVILMDINMPKMSGLEATRQIMQKRSDFAILILTVYDDDNYVLEAIRAGAMGYLLKDIKYEDLVDSIIKVSTGQSLININIASRMLQNIIQEKKNVIDEKGLTDREVEILELVASGCSNKDIANRLFISERTVKNHLSSVFKKIDVHDRTQATLFALREGLANLE